MRWLQPVIACLLLFSCVNSFATERRSPDQRIERLAQTASSVGTALGLSTKVMNQTLEAIRKGGAWAIENGLPMPTAFSIFVDADAGFMIGAELGAELIFIPQENGEIEMGVYSYGDVEAGAKVMAGIGMGSNIYFNLHHLEHAAGLAVGMEADIDFFHGAGIQAWVAVEKDDLRSVKRALKGVAHGDMKKLATSLKSVVRGNAVVAMGASYGWGEGADFVLATGWWSLQFKQTLSKDPKVMNSQLRHFNQQLLDMLP